jgi:uncharacterized membrane protein
MAPDDPAGVRPKVAPLGSSQLPRLLVGVVAGLIAMIALGVTVGWGYAPLVGWDVLALVVVVWTSVKLWPMNPARTRDHARREDPVQPISDLMLLIASVASLIGVIFAVVASGNSHGTREAFLVVLGIVSVVLSWSVVHITFTLRYALLYYTGPKNGIEFNEPDDPQYSDFAYMAFTLGMTYQVSDTNIRTKAIRSTALRQALISYAFGVVIIAILINVIANLG